MIYVLSGPDDFSIVQALESIKAELGDPSTLAMTTTTLEGQNLHFDELKLACETIPFMMGQRLVIVNGLISRFETQTKNRRAKKTTGKTRKSSKQEEAQRFGDYLAGVIPETTVLVFTEGVITGDNPLFQAVVKKATVRSFSLPKDAKLREWVQKRVAEEGGSISSGAVQVLARLVGSNLWQMANEINKLVSYTDGEKIEEKDVNALVGNNEQSSVFELVDAILEFKAERAENILQNQFLNGAAPVYLLYMLSRQLQFIVRAKEMKRMKVTNRDMQTKLGMRSEWQLRKTLDQSGRYSLPRLREVYQSILETDITIKTGKLDPELALNLLAAELCRRGGSSATTAGTRMR